MARPRGRPPKVQEPIESPAPQEETKEVQETTPEAPKKEARKTVAEFMRQYEDEDRLAIPKGIKEDYPLMHFVWVNDNEKRVNMKVNQGYTFIKQTERYKKARGSLKSMYVDDNIRVGDVILMAIPIEQWEARQIVIENKLKLQTRSLKQGGSMSKTRDSVQGTIGREVPIESSLRQERG